MSEEKNPAYGMVRASRISGQATLFQVDYPQQHFIRLSISTASLDRHLSNDWVHSDKELIEIDMSEVQWARFLFNMNTMGVPCTLKSYIDPETKQVTRPVLQAPIESKTDVFKSELKETIKDGLNSLSSLLTQLTNLAAPGATTKKADIVELTSKARRIHMELVQNLPFVLEQAEETIEKSVESAKGEISAFIDHSIMKLGERALGEAALGY